MNKRASSEPQTLEVGSKVPKSNKNWKVLPKGTSTKKIIEESKKALKKAAKKPRVRKPIDRLKFINARANGMSPTQAAFEASGATTAASAAVIGNKLSKDATIQQAVAEALRRKGITIDNAIQPIADGLGAVRDIYDKDGNYMDSTPDHNVRLKASGMALDLMGARNKDNGGGNVHFHLYTNNEQQAYGDT